MLRGFSTLVRAAARPSPAARLASRGMSVGASTESFANGTSAVFFDHMYAAWKADPKSVGAQWHAYFASVDAGAPPGSAFMAAPKPGGVVTAAPRAAGGSVDGSEHVRVMNLIRAFQARTHAVAAPRARCPPQ